MCCISASLKQGDGGGNVTFDITVLRSLWTRFIFSLYPGTCSRTQILTCSLNQLKQKTEPAGFGVVACSVMLMCSCNMQRSSPEPFYKELSFSLQTLNHCDWYLDWVETFITDLWTQMNLYGLFLTPTVSLEMQFEYIKYQTWWWLTSAVLITSSATGVEHQAAQLLASSTMTWLFSWPPPIQSRCCERS